MKSICRDPRDFLTPVPMLKGFSYTSRGRALQCSWPASSSALMVSAKVQPAAFLVPKVTPTVCNWLPGTTRGQGKREDLFGLPPGHSSTCSIAPHSRHRNRHKPSSSWGPAVWPGFRGRLGSGSQHRAVGWILTTLLIYCMPLIHVYLSVPVSHLKNEDMIIIVPTS